MAVITRKLLVAAAAAGVTVGIGVSLASAQTDTPPTTQSPPTTEAPAPDTDTKHCPWRDRTEGIGGSGGGGQTRPSDEATSSAV